MSELLCGGGGGGGVVCGRVLVIGCKGSNGCDGGIFGSGGV